MAKLTKLADHIFGGSHPAGINAEYVKTIPTKTAPLPKVGEYYYFGSLRTSPVVEVTKENEEGFEFRTENSTYKVEFDAPITGGVEEGEDYKQAIKDRIRETA